MATSMGSFKLVYDLVSNGKIPVRFFKSNDTQITVAIADIKGPLVNGFFCLATEAHDDDGLPHTLEHLIFLGSEDYPYKGVLDLLANRCLASGTNAWTDTDHTCYTMTTAGSEGFLQLLPIYVDHILHPTLQESGYITEVHHVNGEGEDAGVVYCEMQARENKGESLIHLAMLRAMYPGQCGYKSETGGIMANLRDSTSHEKVCKYHQAFYRPENLCLIITGSIQPEEVFKALGPMEEKIKKKGLQGSFTRPWQSDIPPLLESVERVIKYPSDEEEHGLVTVAWRGPMAKDQYTYEAVNILLDYLSDTAISPIQRDFVEIDQPYCSEVYQFIIENKEMCFGFNFQNADVKQLKNIAPKLKELLANIAEGREKIDMERVGNLTHRRILDALNSVEEDPHESVACTIIGQFLFGENQQDFEVRLNSIANRQRLKAEPESFWLDLLKKYTQNTNWVVIVGEPSAALMKQMGEEEKARVEAQRKALGPEGLKKCKKVLEQAIIKNETEAPDAMLTSVPVPSADSIHFHPLHPSSNLPSRPGVPNDRFPLTHLPYKFELDDISSNFAQMSILLDTSTLPLNLKYYLPLLNEALMESAVLRDGELINHERVIAELEKDTQSTDTGLGIPPGFFIPGDFPHIMVAQLKVEGGKYERGVQWLRDVMYGTQFTAERLKIVAQRKVADISSLKRSGHRVMKTLLQELVFSKECNFNVASMLRQYTFLNKLLEQLESQPDKVIADMNAVRDHVLQPQNVRVHLSCDTSKVSEKGTAVKPWETFLASSPVNAVGEGGGDRVSPLMKDYVLPLDSSPHRRVIVGVGDVESSYFLQVVPSLDDHHHVDLPALSVLIQYLTQCEGPMWCQIRGLGLSYHYSISIRPDLGLLYFLLSKSSHVVDAYKQAKKIALNFVSGKEEFDEVELESARSSLIFEIIEEEKTVWDAAHESVLAYLRGVEHTYHKELVKKVSEVTMKDLDRVSKKYLAPLFDPALTRCAVCVHPSKVTEIVSEFEKLKVDLKVLPSLDEEFLTTL